jgi:hypothetical protein
MGPLTSLEPAKLRQHDLAVDAARARLAAEAMRARRYRSPMDWRGRIAGSWRRFRTATSQPAAVTPIASTRLASPVRRDEHQRPHESEAA